jgi:hypothetical protein
MAHPQLPLSLLLLLLLLQRRLSQMVTTSQPGDVLVFHYSGHGTQVRLISNPAAAMTETP